MVMVGGKYRKRSLAGLGAIGCDWLEGKGDESRGKGGNQDPGRCTHNRREETNSMACGDGV